MYLAEYTDTDWSAVHGALGQFETIPAAVEACERHARLHRFYRCTLALDVEDDGADIAVNVGGSIRLYRIQ